MARKSAGRSSSRYCGLCKSWSAPSPSIQESINRRLYMDRARYYSCAASLSPLKARVTFALSNKRYVLSVLKGPLTIRFQDELSEASRTCNASLFGLQQGMCRKQVSLHLDNKCGDTLLKRLVGDSRLTLSTVRLLLPIHS
jgi:hypothetical protein